MNEIAASRTVIVLAGGVGLAAGQGSAKQPERCSRKTLSASALVAAATFELEDLGFHLDAVFVVVQTAFAVNDTVAGIE